MANKKTSESKYHIKDFVFIITAVILMGLIAIIVKYFVKNSELYYQIIFSPTAYVLYIVVAIGILSYLFFPREVRIIFSKICYKRIEDFTGEKLTSEIDDKWKYKITRPDLAEKKPDISSQLHNQRDNIVTPLIEACQEGKLEYVISEAKRELSNKDISLGVKLKLRVLLEFSYGESKSYPIQERIDNLFLLCQQQTEKTPLNIRISFRRVLALLYMENNQVELSAQVLNQILYEIKGKVIPTDLKAKINDLKASILLRTNRPHIALAYLKRALSLSKESIIYEYKIAMIYFHGICNPRKALEYARKAFSHISDKEDDDLYQDLIILLSFLEAFMENFQIAYEYIEASQLSSVTVLSYKSYIAYKLGKLDEAESLYTEVLKQAPKDVTAINVKGLLQLDRKEYALAEHSFETILPEFEKETDIYNKFYTAEIYYNKGICNLKLNKFEQAINDFKKAETLGYTKFDAQYLDDINQHIIESNETRTSSK